MTCSLPNDCNNYVLCISYFTNYMRFLTVGWYRPRARWCFRQADRRRERCVKQYFAYRTFCNMSRSVVYLINNYNSFYFCRCCFLNDRYYCDTKEHVRKNYLSTDKHSSTSPLAHGICKWEGRDLHALFDRFSDIFKIFHL